MSIIERIRERKRRKKIKDLCSCCRWYYPESGVCQIKKCSGNGGYGYVTKRNRKRCENFDMTPMQMMTPNEHREMNGCKYVWKGPLPEPRIEEYGTIEHWDGKTITKLKYCEYCGCFSDLVKGTCEHCGAPL